MIRLIALVLLLLNGLFWLWNAGLLAPIGLSKNTEAEPERLTRQLAPERISLLASGSKPLALPAVELPSATTAGGAANAAPTTAPGPISPTAPTTAATATSPATNAALGDKFCLEAGLFAEKDAQALRTALEKEGLGSKTLQTPEAKGVWLVYMGRYPNTQTQEKKQQEVRELNVAMTELPNDALLPGLSLGVYRTRDAASEALKELNKRGIRTARVLQADAKSGWVWLRTNGLNAASSEKLKGLWTGALAARTGGKALQKCEGL